MLLWAHVLVGHVTGGANGPVHIPALRDVVTLQGQDVHRGDGCSFVFVYSGSGEEGRRGGVMG